MDLAPNYRGINGVKTKWATFGLCQWSPRLSGFSYPCCTAHRAHLHQRINLELTTRNKFTLTGPAYLQALEQNSWYSWKERPRCWMLHRVCWRHLYQDVFTCYISSLQYLMPCLVATLSRYHSGQPRLLLAEPQHLLQSGQAEMMGISTQTLQRTDRQNEPGLSSILQYNCSQNTPRKTDDVASHKASIISFIGSD